VPLSFRPIWVNVLTEASRLSSSIPKPCSGRPVEIVSEYLVVLEYLEGREDCILSRGLVVQFDRKPDRNFEMAMSSDVGNSEIFV